MDTAYCTTCRRRRKIVEEFEDSIPLPRAEQVVWVQRLDCGHDMQNATGEEHPLPPASQAVW